MEALELRPGQRVRVHQQIDRREGNWSTAVEGVVVTYGAAPTGSWFAHGKGDRLWLNRIELRKDSGEVSILSVDQHTRVEILSG